MFHHIGLHTVDYVCKIFRGGVEEFMIILCLFIGYQPQIVQKFNFSHKSVIVRYSPFWSFRFRKNYVLFIFRSRFRDGLDFLC